MRTDELEHTPGPWRVALDGTTIHCGKVEDPEIVADAAPCDIMGVHPHFQEGNAKLIATAPDGFALAEFLAGMDLGTRHKGILDISSAELLKAYRMAEALIAKAKS